MTRGTGAILVAALAFLLYRTTLLPGVDFGDTPSFQVMGGTRVVTPRDAYPLYFSIARVFTRVLPGDPAHALNVASAAEAAIACGIIVLVAAELSGSLAAAIAAAWLFAASYTFWSQAVIAEVYALHMLCVALCLLLILKWDRQPTTPRLTAFFLVYALAFGNHLSMILLAPALTIFIVCRRDWRQVVTPRTILLAVVCAGLGALQYSWNLHALWLDVVPPRSLTDGLQKFWFDVTKSDWRESMVFGLPTSMVAERLRMYVFDVHQQFGWIGPILALAGVVQLAESASRRAVLLVVACSVTTAFAFTYNVGDSHVFFLSAHIIVALLAAPGIVGLGRLIGVSWRRTSSSFGTPATVGVAIVVGALAIVRTYHDYPALDRSHDTRPSQWLETLTAGLDDRHAVLLSDLNWQQDNGLNYFARRVRDDVIVARVPDILPHAAELIADNQSIGRKVVLTAAAESAIRTTYGTLVATKLDESLPRQTLAVVASGVPAGTRYALCLLAPTRDIPLDSSELRRSLEYLTGHRMSALPAGAYATVAGLVGEPPSFIHASDRPFNTRTTIDHVPVTVRMESWLAFDTIRRMGFGHIVAGRHHTLIVERGVSFVAFDAQGNPLTTAYAAGIFAPPVRYIATLASGRP